MFSIMVMGGLLTSLATCMFLHKFNIRKVLYFDKWLDLFFDLILPLVFMGTLTGMIIAIIAGISTSLYLHWLKHHKIGYLKPTMTLRGLAWVDVPPHKAR